MKKQMKRIVCFALVLLLVCAVALPVAAGKEREKTWELEKKWELKLGEQIAPGGFTLSGGNWWIIVVGVVVIAAAVVAAVVIARKRRKK